MDTKHGICGPYGHFRTRYMDSLLSLYPYTGVLSVFDIQKTSLKQKMSLVQVQMCPQKSLDRKVKRLLATLHFEQREKLDLLGIEIGNFD
jgi:hypothetical protein